MPDTYLLDMLVEPRLPVHVAGATEKVEVRMSITADPFPQRLRLLTLLCELLLQDFDFACELLDLSGLFLQLLTHYYVVTSRYRARFYLIYMNFAIGCELIRGLSYRNSTRGLL